MYTFFFLYLCELSLALHNTYHFLIKQKKYKTWPLLWFYLLAIWLSLSEAYASIFLFYVMQEEEIYGLAMRATIKLNMGVIQCWMLIELALRITADLRLTESIHRHLSQHHNSMTQRLSLESQGNKFEVDKIIRYGRLILLSSVTIVCLFVLFYMTIFLKSETVDQRIERNAKWEIANGYSFFLLSLCLLVSTGFLINRLRKKREQVAYTNTDRDVFNKEIRKLLAILFLVKKFIFRWKSFFQFFLAILLIFNSTYMARGIFDLTIKPQLTNFIGMLLFLLIGIFCDFFPVALLMVFHYKNFRIITNATVKEATQDEEICNAVDAGQIDEVQISEGSFEVCHLDVIDQYSTNGESPRNSMNRGEMAQIEDYWDEKNRRNTKVNNTNHKQVSTALDDDNNEIMLIGSFTETSNESFQLSMRRQTKLSINLDQINLNFQNLNCTKSFVHGQNNNKNGANNLIKEQQSENVTLTSEQRSIHLDYGLITDQIF